MSGLPIDKLLSVLKTTNGRDKFYRFLVYFSKFLVWRLEAIGAAKDTIQKVDKGAKNVGTARKLFRFGRSLEYVQELVKALSLTDPVLKTTTILKSISFTVWMFVDHIQWLDKAGYISVKDQKTLEKYHARGWFYGLLLNIVADLYKISEINKKILIAPPKDLPALQDKKAEQIVSLTKNSLDALIPATRLEILNINGGIVGLIGAITSVIGLYQAWKGK